MHPAVPCCEHLSPQGSWGTKPQTVLLREAGASTRSTSRASCEFRDPVTSTHSEIPQPLSLQPLGHQHCGPHSPGCETHVGTVTWSLSLSGSRDPSEPGMGRKSPSGTGMHTPRGPGPAWWVSKLRDQVWTPGTQVKSWVLQHTCDQHWEMETVGAAVAQ